MCERLAFGLRVSVRQSLGSDWNATVTRASIASIESTEKTQAVGRQSTEPRCVSLCVCSLLSKPADFHCLDLRICRIFKMFLPLAACLLACVLNDLRLIFLR